MAAPQSLSHHLSQGKGQDPMKHVRSLAAAELETSSLTIGTFDGVHLGHQEIIRRLVSEAREHDRPAVVVTFHPHPAIVLGAVTGPFYLTLPEKRARLLEGLGVDLVVTHPFTEQVSEMSAEGFISRLQEQLHFKNLRIGYDFALGKDREGDPDRLRALGQDYGYSLNITPPIKVADRKVSSSAVRKMLRAGEVEQAARFLGRPFALAGEVVPGDQRGRSLGFPTSNLEVPEGMIDLKPGVYAGFARVENECWRAVTNIGFRPTFEADQVPLRVETHLLDFTDNLYDRSIEVSFQIKLREERKFDGVESLIAQIHRDVEQTRKLLPAESPAF